MKYAGCTYEECYEKQKTLEDLKKEVLNDISIATMFNTDRIPKILEVANKIANKKFNTKINENEFVKGDD